MNLLTPAESKYLGLLAGGLSLDEISKRLGVGKPSLNTAFYNMRKKAGVETNIQLVSAFLTKQLISRNYKRSK